MEKREAFHAEQEAFHRERRAHYAAESERIAANLESFRATAAAATDLVNHPDTPPRIAPRRRRPCGPDLLASGKGGRWKRVGVRFLEGGLAV